MSPRPALQGGSGARGLVASGSLQARGGWGVGAARGSSGVGAGGGHPWGYGRREPEETQEGDPRTAGPGWSWRGHSGGRGGAHRVPGAGLPPSAWAVGGTGAPTLDKVPSSRGPRRVSPRRPGSASLPPPPAEAAVPRAGPVGAGAGPPWSAWLQPPEVGASVATASPGGLADGGAGLRGGGGRAPRRLCGAGGGKPGLSGFLGNRPPPALPARLQVAGGGGWREGPRGPGGGASGSSARWQRQVAPVGGGAPGEAPAPARAGPGLPELPSGFQREAAAETPRAGIAAPAALGRGGSPRARAPAGRPGLRGRAGAGGRRGRAAAAGAGAPRAPGPLGTNAAGQAPKPGPRWPPQAPTLGWAWGDLSGPNSPQPPSFCSIATPLSLLPLRTHSFQKTPHACFCRGLRSSPRRVLSVYTQDPASSGTPAGLLPSWPAVSWPKSSRDTPPGPL